MRMQHALRGCAVACGRTRCCLDYCRAPPPRNRSRYTHCLLRRCVGDNDWGDDSDGPEIAGGSRKDCSREQGPNGQPAPLGARAKPPAAKPRADEVGAQDAFIAGMIYALSRRLLPGAPYIPGMAGVTEPQRTEGGRWKLDECLRCACSSHQLHSGQHLVLQVCDGACGA